MEGVEKGLEAKYEMLEVGWQELGAGYKRMEVDIGGEEERADI